MNSFELNRLPEELKTLTTKKTNIESSLKLLKINKSLRQRFLTNPICGKRFSQINFWAMNQNELHFNVHLEGFEKMDFHLTDSQLSITHPFSSTKIKDLKFAHRILVNLFQEVKSFRYLKFAQTVLEHEEIFFALKISAVHCVHIPEIVSFEKFNSLFEQLNFIVTGTLTIKFSEDFTCNNEELEMMKQKMAPMIECCKSLQIISPMSGFESVFEGNTAKMVNLEFMKSKINAIEEIIQNLFEKGIPSKNSNAQMLLIVKNGAQLKCDLSPKKYVLEQLKNDETFVKMAVKARERKQIVEQFLSCPPLSPLKMLLQIFGNDNQKTAQVFKNQKLTILLDYIKIKDYTGYVKDFYLFVKKNEK